MSECFMKLKCVEQRLSIIKVLMEAEEWRLQERMTDRGTH